MRGPHPIDHQGWSFWRARRDEVWEHEHGAGPLHLHGYDGRTRAAQAGAYRATVADSSASTLVLDVERIECIDELESLAFDEAGTVLPSVGGPAGVFRPGQDHRGGSTGPFGREVAPTI